MSILPYDALDELFSFIDPQILIPIFLAVFILLAGLLLFALVCGLFGAIGLYTLSKRRGYRYPWLAFLPMANVYLLGAVADNISYCRGKRSCFRYILPALSAVSLVFLILLGSLSRNMLYTIYALTGQAALSGSLVWALRLALSGILLRLGKAVVTWFALFKIYRDYQKDRAAVYLALSILLGLSPFFLFALRNRPAASLTHERRTL